LVVSILIILPAGLISLLAHGQDAGEKSNIKKGIISTAHDANVHFSNDYGLTSDYVYDVLVDNIFSESGYRETYWERLRNVPKYGNHLVLRDGTFKYVNRIKEDSDYEITFEGVLVRNEVLKYNWCMRTKDFYDLRNSDAILQKYGLIMRKAGGRYVPEYLKTGHRLEVYANPEVIRRALIVVNMGSRIYGKDIYDPEVFVPIHDSDSSISGLEPAIWIGITGKELLDLHRVEIQWNETESRYELASKLPSSGPGILESKDSNILKDIERESRLNSYFHEGQEIATADAVSPLDVYYLNAAGWWFPAHHRKALGKDKGFRIVDKTTGRSLGLMDRDSFPPSTSVIPMIYCKLLERTSSVLLKKYRDLSPKPESPEERELDMAIRHYKQLKSYYSLCMLGEWNHFMLEACKASVYWTETGFEIVNTETGGIITFRRDDNLIAEALKELNYYREKVDFTSHFMVENYPMFLLSILRLYDVNLQWDEASGQYIIAPGPTDPKRFFEIAAELTFVSDAPDTEYLKQHLTGWIIPVDKESSIEQK